MLGQKGMVPDFVPNTKHPPVDAVGGVLGGADPLIVASGGVRDLQRFPQERPTCCRKTPMPPDRFSSCFHASFADTCERSGQPAATTSTPSRHEASGPEWRAAGCALFPNESSDVVWPHQPAARPSGQDVSCLLGVEVV